MKTSELTGAALDWAVAKCEGDASFGWTAEGTEQTALLCIEGTWRKFKPSIDWAQGGPIIDREKIAVRPVFHAERTENGSDVYRQDGWAAHVEPKAFWITPRPFAGPTPLIAAMRCYVASKLGATVEIPEELKP